MKKRLSTLAIGVSAVVLIAAGVSLTGAYTPRGQVSLSASASVGGGGTSGVGAFTLRVPKLLPFLAFFGKDVVIPVEIQGTGSAANLQAMAVYQLFDSGGVARSVETPVPISFQLMPGRTDSYVGRAVIPVEQLEAARQGSIRYYFRLQRGTDQVVFNNAGTPFQIQFTDTMSFPVDQLGSVAIVPDTSINDGKTSITFSPGVLTNAGTLVVRQLTSAGLPPGPNNLLPIVVYDLSLQATSLVGSAQLALSYPTRIDGSLIGSNANADKLAAYSLVGNQWQLLGPRQWDSTQHTVSVNTAHFSTFALFVSGAVSAIDFLPQKRILTPNGDLINDTVHFSSVDNGVQIFDLRGRRVRSLQGVSPDWDGRDDSGRIVESGLYLYQYTFQGGRISGLILIAK